MFSPRQLLCHGTSVEVFRELLQGRAERGPLSEVTKAAFVYLALSIDKLSELQFPHVRVDVNREVMAGTFDQHDFAFKWSYAEMALLVEGLGFDWAIEQTAKCIEELVELFAPAREREDGTNGELKFHRQVWTPPPITLDMQIW